MLNDVMSVINLVENENDLRNLTITRSLAAIPFGGRYRVIDFVLSNMVNSGIHNIGVFIATKYNSLQRHLGNGKYWDLDRRNSGIRFFQPYTLTDYSENYQRVEDIANFKNNIEFISEAKEDYVLLCRSYFITNIDFQKVYDFHLQKGADITLVCTSVSNHEASKKFEGLDQVEIDEDGFISSVGTNLSYGKKQNISLQMYLMKKDLLKDIILESYEKGYPRTLREAIFYHINSDLKYAAYMHTKDVYCIKSIQNYYDASMSLLKPRLFDKLFEGEGGKIYTRTKDEPSAYYGKNSVVLNSVVANGCIIDGEVANSVIFRGVHIKRGAKVTNSIVFKDSVIMENSSIDSCILDKNVVVKRGKILIGDENHPFVIEKGAVI